MAMLADLDDVLKRLDQAMLLDADPATVTRYGRRVDEVLDQIPHDVRRDLTAGDLAPWYVWRLDERYDAAARGV